jgi:hypothetical protein
MLASRQSSNVPVHQDGVPHIHFYHLQRFKHAPVVLTIARGECVSAGTC